MAGNLRIAAPTAFGRVAVLPVLVDVMRSNPRLRFNLHLSDRYADLNLNEIDLALRFSAKAPSGWSATPVSNVSRRLCASPLYVELHGVPYLALSMIFLTIAS